MLHTTSFPGPCVPEGGGGGQGASVDRKFVGTVVGNGHLLRTFEPLFWTPFLPPSGDLNKPPGPHPGDNFFPPPKRIGFQGEGCKVAARKV